MTEVITFVPKEKAKENQKTKLCYVQKGGIRETKLDSHNPVGTLI